MAPATALTRGKAEAVAIASGATYDLVGPDLPGINTEGNDRLIVQIQMTGAAPGDLDVQVNPFEADQVTVIPIGLPPGNAFGPDLNTGKLYYYAIFDVSGIERVRVRITNNNAAPQTIDRASWRLA